MKKSTPPRIHKIVILGDSGVGKSCLLLRYVDNAFTPSFISTIGVDFKSKTVTYDASRPPARVQFWDTAGQERFAAVTRSYFRGVDGAIVVYDLTNRQSFERVDAWIKSLQAETLAVPLLLVATKIDLQEDARAVTYAEASALAHKYNCKLFEVSAKSGLGVESAINCIVARSVKVKARQVSEPLVLVTGGAEDGACKC